jgi:hypothetical protein
MRDNGISGANMSTNRKSHSYESAKIKQGCDEWGPDNCDWRAWAVARIKAPEMLLELR